MKTRKNLLWMDVIKVFSAFLIVVQHSISYSFTTLPVGGYEWKIMNFIFMIARMGVPVFIMCSGAGMLSRDHTIKEIWHKNIFELLKVYVGWMAVLGVWDVIQIWVRGENANLRVMVNAFIKCILFGKYHTWFIFTLIGLYLITPFLYRIVQQKEYFFYYLLLAIAFTIVLPVFSGLQQLERLMAVVDSINMHFVVGYSLYFAVGYFICGYMERRWEKYAEIIFVLSVVTAYVSSVYMSLKTGIASQEAYGLFSPSGFIMSVSLMVLFKKYIGGGAEKVRLYVRNCGVAEVRNCNLPVPCNIC